MNYQHKYLKYKRKYIKLKNSLQYGGIVSDQESEDIENFPKKTITDANNQFSIILFENLDGASNIISPLSISFVLSLVQLAALGNTNKQLTNILGYKYSSDELKRIYTLFNNQVLKMTNALIINKKIHVNKEYLELIDDMALIHNDDFSNSKLIISKVNHYIENNTNGMIKDVVNENNISPNTIFVLINTIYFKASWQHKFNIQNTTKMKFHKTEGNLVDMMYQKNYFNYYENKSVQVVEMPYDEKDYVMGIVLPRMYLEENGLDYSINNVPQFSKQEMNEFINNLGYEEVELYIPKFTHRKKYDMVPILKKMGLIDVFGINAELDIMARDAYISKIIHEAVVIVDELGTEAAATTVVTGRAMVARPRKKEKPKIFKADHAFIYYIRHLPSNYFLFMGDYQGNKN
ncbi:serpin [Tupanvirus soda lake]|uniref:Serpin n=2 Tax=Tupanvirus TaxID=2094720 RepID=A0A6N1NU59_9VIRU|nr:serpin [Tupanvirus soda lake]QKU35877.1 serpin [Tupanvirus soda lake]